VHGDIDHVVVGPPGVLAIEVKAWSGSIRYDDIADAWTRTNRHNPLGQEMPDPAQQVGKVCSALQRRLRTRVAPVVVFAHPTCSYAGDHPTVLVLVLPQLVPWLLSRPDTMNRQTAAAIERDLTAIMRT
jgi:hypothetical protein